MKFVQEKNISGGSNPSLSAGEDGIRTHDLLTASQLLYIFHNLLILR